MPNPYVFIVGCPRSGTTLLKRLVDAHPAIASPPETHWITRFYKRGTGVAPDRRLRGRRPAPQRGGVLRVVRAQT